MVLNGGHSGKDIGENRGNPIISLGTILSQLSKHRDIYLNSIEGGTWVTSIPREATCEFTTNTLDLKKLQTILEQLNIDLRKMHNNDNIDIVVTQIDTNNIAFDNETTKKIVRYISKFPQGSILRDKKTGDIVFSANLGSIYLEDDSIGFSNSIRSNIDKIKTSKLIEKLINQEKSNGFVTVDTYDFPGYVQNKDSDFINYLINKYKEIFQEDPILREEHFLLECAWFGESKNNLQYVSIAPNIDNPHSPSERVSITSMQKIWEYVKGIVRDLDKSYSKENTSKIIDDETSR